MKGFLKTAFAATLLSATAFSTAPAQAGVSIGLSFGLPGAVGFSYDSGGYCDDWGCPDEYWDMPVYYGPVYFEGRWVNGPLYYRDWRGERMYWIRGGWRRDTWRGPRPHWWKGNYRYGPALGYNFYLRNGFRHDRDRFWRGNDWRPGRDWDRNRWRDHKGPWAHPGNDRMRANDRDDRGGRDNGRDNDRRDNDRGGNGRGNSMMGPGPSNGGNGHGGSMTGPGGAMTGPNGGAMTGPKPGNGGAAQQGGSNGSSNGSGSGDKPKHKSHGDKPDNGN